jgi:alpha-L-rhamnosidase
MIATDWVINDKNFELDVTIPPNTTATVYIPTANSQTVTEGGMPVADADSVQFLQMEQKNAVFAVGSGQYHFESKLP